MTDRLDVTVGGVRLACRASGGVDDPPMVLLHALGDESSTWDAVRAQFDQSYRVLSIDLRGHGDSDWPGAYSFELMRDDVLGVLDHLRLQSITLIGHSMGGMVAYLLAQEQPNRFNRLILEDTPPPYPRNRDVPARPDGPLRFDWAVVPAVHGQLNDPNPAWWPDRLSGCTTPTLLIGGGPGSHIPQDKLREVAQALPSCTMVTIPVGHLVHETAAAEFIAVVKDFLSAG